MDGWTGMIGMERWMDGWMDWDDWDDWDGKMDGWTDR